MTKAEMHYLNCTDENCEIFFCVARRDYERQISELQSRVREFNNSCDHVWQHAGGSRWCSLCEKGI